MAGVATVQQCEQALAALDGHLRRLDPRVRRRRVPQRSVGLVVPDLGVAFRGRLGPDGVEGLTATDREQAAAAQVRFVADSDQVVAIGQRPIAFVGAFARGRVKVHASWRDLFELRRVL